MLAGLVGLFALGTVGFWILIAVVCGLLIWAVEYEKPGWATLSLAATFGLLGWLGDFNVLTATRDHPLIALGCIGGYILLGTAYSFVKWWRFLKARRAEYLDAKAQFLESRNVAGDAIPDQYLEQWKNDRRSVELGTAPKARDHKARILTWMIYWPWSGLWTLINDPIKKLFKAIYRELQAQYQKIADSVFADVKDDFRAPPPNDPTDTRVASADDRRVPRQRGAGE